MSPIRERHWHKKYVEVDLLATVETVIAALGAAMTHWVDVEGDAQERRDFFCVVRLPNDEFSVISALQIDALRASAPSPRHLQMELRDLPHLLAPAPLLEASAQGVGEARREMSLALATELVILVEGRCVGLLLEPDRGESPALWPGDKFYIVPVYFGTDRNRTGDDASDRFFGKDRGELTLGKLEVSIPHDHETGEIERPAAWKFWQREDPTRHVVVLEINPLSRVEFVASASSDARESTVPDALVFIHGFNVKFPAAARRAAQLAYDLRFSGVPMLYSWPSAGKPGPFAYNKDEENIDWTTRHLREFFKLVAEELGLATVHVVAHSMGNRVLVDLVRELRHVPLSDGAANLRQVVFAAPDISAETFADRAAEFWDGADRYTLYASSRDWALAASQKYNGYARAGDAGDDLVVVDGVDTIDASLVETDFLGHSYIGDSASIITDMRGLIGKGQAPSDRENLIPRDSDGLPYWAYEPAD